MIVHVLADQNFSYKVSQYIYKEAEESRPTEDGFYHRKFEGLSLQEISKFYGEEQARTVFSYAATGYGDLTKPLRPQMDTYKVHECVKFGLEISVGEMSTRIGFYIIGSAYNSSETKLMETINISNSCYYKYLPEVLDTLIKTHILAR